MSFLHRPIPRRLLYTILLCTSPFSARAIGLTSPDPDIYDYGGTTLIVGHSALVGAPYGASVAYLYRNLEASGETEINQPDLKFTTSDASRFFGYAMDMLGDTVIIGAHGSTIGDNRNQGAAYVYRNVNSAASGSTLTENIKLINSDGEAYDNFGSSVNLSGNMALVGAFGKNNRQGVAYLYRNLDTASDGSTITEDLVLMSSDAAANDYFGNSADISDNMAVIGAYGKNDYRGAVFVYRDLDTATGTTITENATLVASDGSRTNYLGESVSLSGTDVLAGAYGQNTRTGAAYLFRNVDQASGTVTEDVKLMASDGQAEDCFGSAVSLSGNTALVGAYQINEQRGGAYLYVDLDQAAKGSTVTEHVKITASDGEAYDWLGDAVSVSGDQFMIGAYGKNNGTGKAYYGTISSITTLNTGNTTRVIAGLSFESRMDWTIGETTGSNQVILSAGDTASVLNTGKAVYIGREAGSNDNSLIIRGTLAANDVYIGASGNMGNMLRFDSTSDLSGIDQLYLSLGSILSFETGGDPEKDLFDYLGSATLNVRDGDGWLAMTRENYDSWLDITTEGNNYMNIRILSQIPEPAGTSLVAVSLAGLAMRRRKRAGTCAN